MAVLADYNLEGDCVVKVITFLRLSGGLSMEKSFM